MVYHDLYLPLIIGIVGLIAGIYILSKVKRLPKDKILVLDFALMGIVHIYVGIIYMLFLAGTISTISDLSVFVRPAMLLQIGLPAVITWRMGVVR